MAGERNFNIVTNVGLHCFEVKEMRNKETNEVDSLLLRCGFGSRKKDDGNYTKSLPVSVWVRLGECEIEEDDYNGQAINVDGYMYASEYTNNEGKTYAQLNFSASKVTKRTFDN